MRLLILAAAVAALPATAALSQDETGEGPIAFELGAATFTFSGQLNFGVLVYDDGFDRETYAPVGNDNSSTRLTLEFEADLSEAATLGGTLEVEYQPYASDVVSLEVDEPDYSFQDDDLRKLELFVETGLGTVWVGQGDMASNESAEVDLSGTTVAANSELDDTDGGQILRLADGALSDVTIADAFDNLDGLSRIVRVRYDAPAVLDDRLTLSASYGQDRLADDDTDQYDVAALFESEGEVLTVGAAIAYAWEGEDVEILSGSASVLHGPTGISLTFASGREDDAGEEGGYAYVKLGYERDDLLPLGGTAMSLDYYRSEDLAAEGSEGRSVGLAVVQTIEAAAGLEVYAVVRSHEYDEDAADFEDARAVLVGARYRF